MQSSTLFHPLPVHQTNFFKTMYKFLWVFLPLLTIACNRKQAEATMKPNAPFENTRWKITSIAGVAQLPATEKEMFIRFAESRFSAFAGCNNMMGGYTVQGNTLKITGPASTMMACPEPFMKSEQKFGEALGKVDNFKITGDKMQLRQGDTVLAGFEAVYLK